jgi:Tfp pilus assembly protein PilF
VTIKIDNLFYPAKVNLAMLYNQMGKNSEAENLLREVVITHPEIYDVYYSLGLLLAEEKKYAEAANYLKQAAKGMPNRARIHYNLGLLRQHLKQELDAEEALLKAQELEPDNLDYLYALADFYLKRKELQKARSIAKEMVARHPTQRIGHDILNLIEKNVEANTN